MQYRLHIDIPLGHDEDQAVDKSKMVMDRLLTDQGKQFLIVAEIDTVNYRVGHDEDRQKSNYLDKNENGHVSNKKTKIYFGND